MCSRKGENVRNVFQKEPEEFTDGCGLAVGRVVGHPHMQQPHLPPRAASAAQPSCAGIIIGSRFGSERSDPMDSGIMVGTGGTPRGVLRPGRSDTILAPAIIFQTWETRGQCFLCEPCGFIGPCERSKTCHRSPYIYYANITYII